MHKILDKLTAKQKKELLALQQQVTMIPATSHRRRAGAKGIKNLSEYSTSKFLFWTAAQRKVFKEAFPDNANDKAVIKWFLQFDETVGFLDTMTLWENEISPQWITAYNLKGNGVIVFGKKTIKVPVGKGITFPLSDVHEVPKTPKGSIWACAMTREDVWPNS